MSKRTTIKDLAVELGVSKSTVSRALRDSAEISKETKERIRRLAEEWNFRPSLQARSLRGDKSYIVGIVVPKIAHTYFSSAISGIQEELRRHNYSAFISESNESFEEEQRVTSELVAANVDGVIISVSAETTDFEHLRVLHNQHIPIVFFDRICNEMDCSKVIISHEQASYRATRHLIERRCKKIIHLSGPKGLSITQSRIKGFKDALQDAFIPFFEESVIAVGYDPMAVEPAIHKLIAEKKSFDGITCFNDEIAVAAIRSLKKVSLHVPSQVKVVGFNNEPIAEIIEPSLTTIDHPAHLLGQHAARLFIKHMHNDGKIKPSTVEIDTRLIIRDSTSGTPGTVA